jgi:CRISPR/Cas system-associated exonuclease Cas4 (RecB family)
MCVTKKTGKEYSNPQMRVTYGIGSALHFWCQNTDSIFGNNRIGWWKCLACGEVRYFGTPPVSQCSCGASEKASIYYEHGLSIEKYYVGGHPDLFIFVLNVDGEKFLRVVEIKSISGKGFEELKHPLAAHETQVNVYMWFASEDKTLPLKVDPSIGYVLYISKRHVSKKLPFKLFPVKRNEKLIERVSKLLDDFKIGIKEYPKYLPEKHPECKRNFSCYRANWCDVRAECKKHR